MTPSVAAAAIADFQTTFDAVRREIAKVVIGHEHVACLGHSNRAGMLEGAQRRRKGE